MESQLFASKADLLERASLDNQTDDTITKKKVGAASTLAQCQPGYVPSTDATVANNYKFWSIDGAPFNKSVYTPYMTNILTGLKLTYYFEYSTECTQQV